jgi:hypothetical protein
LIYLVWRRSNPDLSSTALEVYSSCRQISTGKGERGVNPFYKSGGLSRPEIYHTGGTVAADRLAQGRGDQREELTLFITVEVYPDLSSTALEVYSCCRQISTGKGGIRERS